MSAALDNVPGGAKKERKKKGVRHTRKQNDRHTITFFNYMLCATFSLPSLSPLSLYTSPFPLKFSFSNHVDERRKGFSVLVEPGGEADGVGKT